MTQYGQRFRQNLKFVNDLGKVADFVNDKDLQSLIPLWLAEEGGI